MIWRASICVILLWKSGAAVDGSHCTELQQSTQRHKYSGCADSQKPSKTSCVNMYEHVYKQVYI
eukprot:1443-Heterococcus_DN1.PRE.12